MRQKSDMPHLLRQLAMEGLAVRIDGNCMSPHFSHGQRVEVAKTRHLWPGDILVYFNPQGQMVAHRMLGPYRRDGSWKLLIQADSARRPDSAVSPEQVLGRVKGIKVSLRDRTRAVGRYLHFALFGRLVRRGR